MSNVAFNSDKTAIFSSRLYQPIISKWDFRAAYIDFGFSLKFNSSTDPSTWTSTSGWGTWPHIAPEKEAATTTGTPYKALPAD
ncbi:MAG TPA: hypothetical protein VGO47_02130, partial [Chlamydiales bacterium]|nr:hypothetical protein [Chlamydiales bacterium]